MEEANIVPNIIDIVPPAQLIVTYRTVGAIENGKEYKPADLIQPPFDMSWHAEAPGTLYTLNMADLGPAEDTNYKQVNHWTIVNIPGPNAGGGFAVAPYTGPKPRKDSGLKRFLLTVYKQSQPLFGIPPAISQAERHNFDIRTFANTYGLGNPVAGVYFTAQPDEYSVNYWEKGEGSSSWSKSGSASGSFSFKCALL